ncbi:MAG TPA: hypothetical protein PLC43_04715 [Caldisericia bacterium]|nr:hypothetical protein [Caldisericia bacterium]
MNPKQFQEKRVIGEIKIMGGGRLNPRPIEIDFPIEQVNEMAERFSPDKGEIPPYLFYSQVVGKN